MTSRVPASRSSNVTVVTTVPSSPSSFVQTRRVGGVTSRYRPKNAIGSPVPMSKVSREAPPAGASTSHDSSLRPMDFGTHHCRNSSASVQASNTMSRGPSIVRVTTSSCSEVRSIVVRSIVVVASDALWVSIVPLLPSSLRDDLLEPVEPGVPQPALLLDPRGLVLEPPRTQPAPPDPPDLLGRDELRVLQHPDVLPHARQGHVECVGQIRDRRVASSEPLQDATTGGIGQRCERGIESAVGILNHLVQFIRLSGPECKSDLLSTSPPASSATSKKPGCRQAHDRAADLIGPQYQAADLSRASRRMASRAEI